MSTKINNLVQQTSVSTGTGNLTLATQPGFQSFDSAFGHGATTNVFYYFISDVTNSAWEFGTGHMSASTTFVRDTVLGSTNANAAVNFLGGTLQLVNDIPAASQIVSGDAPSLVGTNFSGTGASFTAGLTNCPRTTQTTTYAPTTTDNGSEISFAGAGADATWTIVAGATNGANWNCIFNNPTLHYLTIKVTTNTIDGIAGATGFIMYPGEVRRVYCNGTNYFTTILKGFFLEVLKAASPLTFYVPPGYQAFDCEIWGGGGGGGNASTTNGGGGGGGGYNLALITAANMGSTTQTVTIGGGGAGGVAGGETSIGSLLTAFGGGFGVSGGGGGGSPTAAGGNAVTNTGGTGAGPYPLLAGLKGTAGIDGWFGGGGATFAVTSNGGFSIGGFGGGGGGGGAASTGGVGGSTTYAGGGGGSFNTTAGGGGTSVYGGNGGAAGTNSVNGTNGTIPGGGGGGCGSAKTAGAGGDGKVWIKGVV